MTRFAGLVRFGPRGQRECTRCRASGPDPRTCPYSRDGDEVLAVQHGPRSGHRAALACLEQTLVLEHSLAGPAQGRAAVARFAREVGLECLSDDLVLIVSELVTNAVRYGAPPVRLTVSADAGAITVTVVDGTPDAPRRRHADGTAEGGRGLLLIDLLADDTGVRPEPPGKAVWAAVRGN